MEKEKETTFPLNVHKQSQENVLCLGKSNSLLVSIGIPPRRCNTASVNLAIAQGAPIERKKERKKGKVLPPKKKEKKKKRYAWLMCSQSSMQAPW